ncbi:hypothetical protein GCM10011504_57750 [Siccirubricoccus deserti]|nr:hypothetical protein GCM10011504_57750 [Siccirubricoccus deserti]
MARVIFCSCVISWFSIPPVGRPQSECEGKDRAPPTSSIFGNQHRLSDQVSAIADEWAEILGNERLTGALLDRLTHHVHTLEMNGESYRLAQSKRRRRHGTKGPLAARFTATRVRVGDGETWANNRHLPGDEVWLVGEWRSNGERKYHLSNLTSGASLRALASAIKARWVCEQVHQQLKQELGLGHFEGRSWTGLHRHALMTCIAFAYLQHLRLAQHRRTSQVKTGSVRGGGGNSGVVRGVGLGWPSDLAARVELRSSHP